MRCVGGRIPKYQLSRENITALFGDYFSGEISGGTEVTKRNLEMSSQDESYLKAIKLVDEAVRGHQDFMFTDFTIMNFYSPTALTPGLLALMPLGQDYVRSDLSMTLLLTPPDAYDGGELSFAERGEPVRYKLPAGARCSIPRGRRTL